MMTTLTAADGHELDCWMATAQGERRGGLVIVQEIFGITDQLKGVADHYAALGYDVAIPALFDRHEKGAVVPFDEAPRGRDMMLASDLDQTMMDIDAAVGALAARGGKVGVIGFCWGGGLAIRSAQVLDVACAVSFYGTRLPQYLDKPLKAPVLAHFGAQDDHVPPEMRAEAQAALPEMEVHLYEAGHAFANDARPSYVADAAASAHDRTEAFLAKHLA
ncbi:dienelactone hydrolase family protein [Maritalea mobilis]|uniref:dienelactone hydrolase family protein n=1 Tax=Maritalea mobilis TaxID=483324 RepID=UPI001C94F2E8|nr:dienelactone hydrolase family protein [Maritalea mobilis]MBY6200989.1 dienelactone hydrolase family protein [Maritalea mobilis]